MEVKKGRLEIIKVSFVARDRRYKKMWKEAILATTKEIRT